MPKNSRFSENSRENYTERFLFLPLQNSSTSSGRLFHPHILKFALEYTFYDYQNQFFQTPHPKNISLKIQVNFSLNTNPSPLKPLLRNCSTLQPFQSSPR